MNVQQFNEIDGATTYLDDFIFKHMKFCSRQLITFLKQQPKRKYDTNVNNRQLNENDGFLALRSHEVKKNYYIIIHHPPCNSA